MSNAHNSYNRIPEFFLEQCVELGLPIETVVSNTHGFVWSILALPDVVDRIHIHRYIAGGSYNYLRCYLQVLGGLTPNDACTVANTVRDLISRIDIPLDYGPEKK